MDRVTKYLMLVTACSCLTGCVTVRNTGKSVTSNPSPYVLTPDVNNRVSIDMDFWIPEDYFSKRSRLFITPQFVLGDTVAEEYFPLVVDAPIYNKKIHRKQVLEGYQDPYAGHVIRQDHVSRAFEINYQDTLQLPADAQNGRMRAIVSTDGCGQCTGIDTFYIASVSNPITLMQNKLKTVWMDYEFVVRPKVMEGKGEAKLQFIINRHDINLELGNNRQELDSMRRKLEPILKDTLATIEYINIYGMASADGSLPFNTTLSRNRANSALKWLVDVLNINLTLRRKMQVGSRPEGWQPVFQAMVADNNPDSVAVKDILMRYASDNDDVQERHIRRLPCWNTIKERYLQKDRKVEYAYAYKLRSFTTNEELLAMYEVRPDAFNMEELLQVAELFTDIHRKREVYERVIRDYPESDIAAANLAAIYLQDDNLEQAAGLLSKVEGQSPELNLNRAVVNALQGNEQMALDSLCKIELPEASYNKGVLLARKRHFAEAYELLKPYADMNTAIVALAINRNEEASQIMEKVQDNSPLAEYVRALAAARMGDAYSCKKHLRLACQDETLARRAVDEPDFFRFRGESTFNGWLQQEGGAQ